jgi:pimeloyl-ACP methyl ester carboxylesterase
VRPIVVFGGFLSFSMLYAGLRDALAQVSGQPVWVVETSSYDWLPSIVPLGWAYLLRKLDRTVHRAAHDAPADKVTLVGHSAGGVLSRMYLSPEPFLGHTYGGMDHVDNLITLGSPHYNGRRLMYGGMMSRWVEKRYPGAFFAPRVRYTSVVGSFVRGDRDGTLAQQHTYAFYKAIAGAGDVWGDGLIPLTSALLSGAQHIVLDGVAHFAGFGPSWYGTPAVVREWWSQANAHTRGAEP